MLIEMRTQLTPLLIFFVSFLGRVWTCAQDQYASEVDTTKCWSSDKVSSQLACTVGRQPAKINLSHFCCAICRLCDVCGLGIFLYHDFEGRACSRNSNVVCCEEENMDVYYDHCVHRVTTTTVTTTMKASVAVSTRPAKNVSLDPGKVRRLYLKSAANAAERAVDCTDRRLVTLNFFLLLALY